jgi:hypothetical protein
MSAFADANAAVEHLVELERRGRLPFTCYQIGPRDGRVDVAVPRSDRQTALEYFAAHPLPRTGAEPIRVDVRVLAGAAWGSEPVRGAAQRPDPAALDDLVGLDVNEAALRANAGGWVVRAYEPEAVLTADMRMNRVNLQFSEVGRVVAVRVG